MTQSIQRSFTSGEIAPSLRSRADLAKYTTGLARCENFFIRPQGGAYSRAGQRFIGEVAASATAARLIPFSFNTTQTYILVFEHLTLQVIMNGAYVETAPGVRFTLVTPYTLADLARLQYTQSADVMTITHPSYAPRSLSRTAHTVWTLTVDNFAPSVAAPVSPALVAVGTASGAANKTYSYVVTAVDANGVESVASPSVNITQNALSVTYGVKVTITAVVGAVKYRIYKDPSLNTGVFGWIGETTGLTFDDYNIGPITSSAPPKDNQPFGNPAADGALTNPSTVGYYQQRRLYANSTADPQTLWASQTADYLSLRFSEPARDDDSISFTVASRQVNEIRHVIGIDGLLMLTSGGVWRVTEGVNSVLTPATVGVRQSSYHGANWVMPEVVGSSVIYIQDKGSRVRDLKYEWNADKYQGNDLSVMSEHLFENHTITSMSYSEEPYSIVWMVRDDGVLLGLTYLREHQVFAWHKHTTAGTYESVATISEGGRDATYVIVNRTIGAVTKRYVERIEPRIFATDADSFCVDSGLTYTGAPATVMSGLTHLEGETVVALADGNVVENMVVTGGAVTLPFAASQVHIGLPYTCTLETLDVDMTDTKQTLKGREVSVSRVFIEVEKSRGGWVGPIVDPDGSGDDTTATDMLEIKPRTQADGYGSIALKSFKQEITIADEWNLGGGVRIEQRSPLPLSILSIIPDITIGG